jgi:hypothetical protein
MNPGELFKQIKRYVDLGWHPIPWLCYLENGERVKKPILSSWKNYQKRPPTQPEIESWIKNPLAKYYGIALALRDVLVVDFDQKDGKPDLLEYDIAWDVTMWTETASGGKHAFYLNADGLGNTTNIFNGDKKAGDTLVDLRGNGGVIIAGGTELWNMNPLTTKDPESLKAIAKYRTENIMRPEELPKIPDVFLIKNSEGERKAEPKYKNIVKGEVSEGERNETAASLAFRMQITVKTQKDYTTQKKAYWGLVAKFKDFEKMRDEYENAWASATKKLKAERGEGWPDRANEIIREEIKKVKTETEYNEDMDGWNFKIKAILRLGELFKFELEDGNKFILKVEDVYSELKFRNAYTFGTNKILPPIRKRSYEMLIAGFVITDIADTGASGQEIVKEILDTQAGRITEAETEDEAIEAVFANSWAILGNKIYFKPASIFNHHPFLQRKFNPSEMASFLQDIGAKQERKASNRFWTYELASKTTI